MNSAERKFKTTFIKKNIVDFCDVDILNTYNTIKGSVKNSEKHDTRCEQISFIENNLRNINDDELKVLEENIKTKLKTIETNDEKMKRVTLEIVNKLLVVMGYDVIDDLCDFYDIKRDELIEENCSKIFNENKEYILNNGFNKAECKIYQNIKYVHLSILKAMLKKIGYSLQSKNNKKMIKGITTMHTTYYIKKK
jgi:hypothetical protein